jgi:hypothetical protein
MSSGHVPNRTSREIPNLGSAAQPKQSIEKPIASHRLVNRELASSV